MKWTNIIVMVLVCALACTSIYYYRKCHRMAISPGIEHVIDSIEHRIDTVYITIDSLQNNVNINKQNIISLENQYQRDYSCISSQSVFDDAKFFAEYLEGLSKNNK